MKIRSDYFRTFGPDSEDIIKSLYLRKSIYKQTVSYGHFGRMEIELLRKKLDKANELKAVSRKHCIRELQIDKIFLLPYD